MMNMELIKSLRNDAHKIMESSLQAVLPDKAVSGIIGKHLNSGKKYFLVSVGKAAWTMAKTAKDVLGGQISGGIVLSKYHHIEGPVNGIMMLEAGHPVPDAASVSGTRIILDEIKSLDENIEILFLLSGGGSALFELPVDGVVLEDIQNITEQLLACGADITEINTIRKRLSKVKAGGFAALCGNRFIHAIILSDVIGNRVDSIASGPVSPDSSTREDALAIVEKYSLKMNHACRKALDIEPVKQLSNVDVTIAGSVDELCDAAAAAAEALGYSCIRLSSAYTNEARALGTELAAAARSYSAEGRVNDAPQKTAWIAGGETIVKLTGQGKGGRNQEFALSSAMEIEGIDGIVAMGFGSDGTDGPTDAAGGIVDGYSVQRMKDAGLDPSDILQRNDSYNGLKAGGDLLITGPTGTNVNDLYLVLKEQL